MIRREKRDTNRLLDPPKLISDVSVNRMSQIDRSGADTKSVQSGQIVFNPDDNEFYLGFNYEKVVRIGLTTIGESLDFSYDPVTDTLLYTDAESGETVVIRNSPFDYNPATDELTYTDAESGETVVVRNSPFDYNPATDELTYTDAESGETVVIRNSPFDYNDLEETLTYTDPATAKTISITNNSGLQYTGLANDTVPIGNDDGQIWYSDVPMTTQNATSNNVFKVIRANHPFYYLGSDNNKDHGIGDLMTSATAFPFENVQMETAGIVHPVNISATQMNDIALDTIGRYSRSVISDVLFIEPINTFSWLNNFCYAVAFNLPCRATAYPVISAYFHIPVSGSGSWRVGIAPREVGLRVLDGTGHGMGAAYLSSVRMYSGNITQIEAPKDVWPYYSSLATWPSDNIPVSTTWGIWTVIRWYFSPSGPIKMVIGTANTSLTHNLANESGLNPTRGVDTAQPYADMGRTTYNHNMRAPHSGMLSLMISAQDNAQGQIAFGGLTVHQELNERQRSD